MRPPDLRLLAYEERKPMLRVVGLADASVEPAPVSVDTGYALDNCIRRDGWIAFWPNLDLWAVPLPFGPRPSRIANHTRVVGAGINSRTVWAESTKRPLLVEYDGVSGDAVREIDLPASFAAEEFRLVAESREGFLANAADGGLYVWEPPDSPRLIVEEVMAQTDVDPTGTTVLCTDSGELVLVDVVEGTTVPIAMPKNARCSAWNAVFSPDGGWLALDLDYSVEQSEEELFEALEELVRGHGHYEPQPHRLGLVRCADGALTVVDPEYDNFANIVWSLDGEWLVLSTPFAHRAMLFTRRDDPQLQSIEFRRAPSVLCDVSDLLA